MARLAGSLETLRAQIDARWPDRDKSADGWIGDAAHRARQSDHNPDAKGVVHALDITHDPASGCDCGKISEALRASRDTRIKYVIFNRRIFSPARDWAWREYTGSNPHTSHMHVSVNADGADGADAKIPWHIGAKTPMSGKVHYDRDPFFATVRETVFGGSIKLQQQVDGMNAHLDFWEPLPFTDRRWLAYAMATDLAETLIMQPIAEAGKGQGHAYGVPDPETGKAYYGRGRVQLTWKGNYARATKEINDRNLVGRKVDLVSNPDQALEDDIALTVLYYGMAEGWFTGKKFADYLHDDVTDFVGARRIVNGQDRAQEIAEYAQGFLQALDAAATEAEPEQAPGAIPDKTTLDPVLAALKARIKDRTGAKEIHLIL